MPPAGRFGEEEAYLFVRATQPAACVSLHELLLRMRSV